MNPMAAYQIQHTRELTLKKIMSDPKRRKRYLLVKEKKEKIAALELHHRHNYWFNVKKIHPNTTYQVKRVNPELHKRNTNTSLTKQELQEKCKKLELRNRYNYWLGRS